MIGLYLSRTPDAPGALDAENADFLSITRAERDLCADYGDEVKEEALWSAGLFVSVLLTRLVKRGESVRDWGKATHFSYS